jgi:DNA-binding SARP family transcriptional activator
VPDESATEYEKIIRKDRYNEKAYDRLMIIYRKNKDYAKELKLIEAGIRAFIELFNKASKESLIRKRYD